MQRNDIISEITVDNIKYPNTQLIVALEPDGSEIIEGSEEDFVIPMGRTVILTNGYAISKSTMNPFFVNKVLEKAGVKKVLHENVTWYDAAWFCNELSKLFDYEQVYDFKNVKKNRSKGGIIESAEVTSDVTKNGFRLPTLAETDLAFKGCNVTPIYQTWCNDCFTTIASDETVFDPQGEETGTLRTTAQTNGIGKLKYASVDINSGASFCFRICRNIIEE